MTREAWSFLTGTPQELLVVCMEMLYIHIILHAPAYPYSTLYRHRRRHVHCAGMGVPVLQTTASERRSFGVPARPYPRNGHAVGDAETEPTWTDYRSPMLGELSQREFGAGKRAFACLDYDANGFVAPDEVRSCHT